MNKSALYQCLAVAALFLLPLSALNFGVSITLGDLFFVLAALLNGRRLADAKAPHLWFLLAAPLFIASAANDLEATWKSIGQAVYIFGFVVPFGWCAFADLPVQWIVRTMVASAILNSFFAVGQFSGVIPPLPTQQIVEYFGGRMLRVSGLGNAVNELTQSLAPLIALLPLLKPAWLRTPAMLGICGGMAAGMSKQAVIGVLGLVWFVWKEGWRQWVLGAVVVIGGTGLLALLIPETTDRVVTQFVETVVYRESYMNAAIDERVDLLSVAINSLPECLLLGYGPLGSFEVMIRHGHAQYVHVYLIGLAMIGGVPAALLICAGTYCLLRQLYGRTDIAWCIYLTVALLGMQCHTVVMMSWQSLPLLLAGAIVVQPMPAPRCRRNATSRPAFTGARSVAHRIYLARRGAVKANLSR